MSGLSDQDQEDSVSALLNLRSCRLLAARTVAAGARVRRGDHDQLHLWPRCDLAPVVTTPHCFAAPLLLLAALPAAPPPALASSGGGAQRQAGRPLLRSGDCCLDKDRDTNWRVILILFVVLKLISVSQLRKPLLWHRIPGAPRWPHDQWSQHRDPQRLV